MDGEPADLGDVDGDVTATVTRSDGTVIVTSGNVTGFGSSGPRVRSLPAEAVAEIDWLTVVWSNSGVELHTEIVEVSGPGLGTIAALTGPGPNFKQYKTEIHRERRAIEDLATRIMKRSPIQRFFVERVSGDGSTDIVLRWPNTLAIKWVKEWNTDGTSTSFSAAEIADLVVDESGIVYRSDHSAWTCGHKNYEIAYEHGWLDMPHDLRLDLYRAIRYRVGAAKTAGAPDRATSMATFDGVRYTLATPGMGQWSTGLPDVDEKLMGYEFYNPGVA
jgi:hypothetical protein